MVVIARRRRIPVLRRDYNGICVIGKRPSFIALQVAIFAPSYTIWWYPMNTSLILTIAVLLALITGGCAGDTDAQDTDAENKSREILVFAAASLRESMEELGTAFEDETGTKVLFNFAGSNDLAHQIIAAPRADIFFSAADNWMDTVEKAGKIVKKSRRDILSNTLVVVANRGMKRSLPEPCGIMELDVRNIAIGDPESVPAGKYARAWLSSVVCDEDTLWTKLKDRIVPTPDVRAALGLVLADTNVISIVYRTDQLALMDRTRVLYEVKDGPPIRYVIARTTDGPAPDDAQRFYDYVVGREGAKVFMRYGFRSLPQQVAIQP
jgi:molybdate transport system substrate-binding protein